MPSAAPQAAIGMGSDHMHAADLVRRSSLIMPVNQPRFVEKAYLRGADAIVLDLEDAVPPREKARARALVKDAIPLAARGGADVLVRVNKPVEMLVEDLDAAIHPGLNGIAVPKAESAAEIHMLDELVSYWERRRGIPAGTVQLAVSVETAKGVLRAEEIATASPRLVSIGAGPEDLALDLGIESTVEGREFLYVKLRMVIVANAAGVQPLGLMGTLADYRDLEGLARSAREAYRVGFRGAGVIHPAQVPICNQAYAPTAEQVAWARRVIAAFEEGVARGTASVAVDGRMIDIPIAEKAGRLLARAAAIEAKEARKAAALRQAGAA
jgi:citrate lyase subunit beta/citryl-CoA lyase